MCKKTTFPPELRISTFHLTNKNSCGSWWPRVGMHLLQNSSMIQTTCSWHVKMHVFIASEYDLGRIDILQHTIAVGHASPIYQPPVEYHRAIEKQCVTCSTVCCQRVLLSLPKTSPVQAKRGVVGKHLFQWLHYLAVMYTKLHSAILFLLMTHYH